MMAGGWPDGWAIVGECCERVTVSQGMKSTPRALFKRPLSPCRILGPSSPKPTPVLAGVVGQGRRRRLY